MTNFPEPEGYKLIPEGHYEFRINKEPILKGFTYKDREGNEKQGRKMVVYAVGLNDEGEFSVIDNIATFEPRYRELCEALKVEHGKDIQVTGAIFEADVKHEPSKNDPTKIFPRLVNITGKGDDDVPI